MNVDKGKLIIQYIQQHEGCTSADIQRDIGIPPSTTARIILDLFNNLGVDIIRRGNGLWINSYGFIDKDKLIV